MGATETGYYVTSCEVYGRTTVSIASCGCITCTLCVIVRAAGTAIAAAAGVTSITNTDLHSIRFNAVFHPETAAVALLLWQTRCQESDSLVGNAAQLKPQPSSLQRLISLPPQCRIRVKNVMSKETNTAGQNETHDVLAGMTNSLKHRKTVAYQGHDALRASEGLLWPAAVVGSATTPLLCTLD